METPIYFWLMILMFIVCSFIGSSLALLVFGRRLNRTVSKGLNQGIEESIARQLKKEDEWVRKAGR